MTWQSCQHVVTVVIPREMGLAMLAGYAADPDASLANIGAAVADIVAQDFDTASIVVDWEPTADPADEFIFAFADEIAPSDLDLTVLEEQIADAVGDALEDLRHDAAGLRELIVVVTPYARKEAA